MRRPRVEILYFDGCPNHASARALVERVAAQLQLEPDIRFVEVTDPEAAVKLRFLGSPTVRVNGLDVEPGAHERRDFSLSCRINRSERGASEQPQERWVREALIEAADVAIDGAGAHQDELPPSVSATLALADIPRSKLGAARRARLGHETSELYIWILRHFATAGRPSSTNVRAAARRLGIDAEEALATLAGEDLVHCGADGEISVAYPFSGRPTAHQVRFPGGHRVHAMCAIDALGIASMFGEQIEIESRDPLSGEEIRAQVTRDGAAEWWPQSVVVVAGALRSKGDACCGCCPVLNFFVSPSNAQRWLAEHPSVRGRAISIPDAAAAGQAVFGDVLAHTRCLRRLKRRRRRCG